MDIYVVRAGDTIDSIAQKLETDPEQLIYDNQLVYPYELAVGQALFCECCNAERYTGGAEDITVTQNDFVRCRNATRAISVSGYAYPFISSWVLEQTLPFLSELAVFSYGFTMEGELVPPMYGEDEWMIGKALRFGTQPILTLTPLDPDGRFNNRLIHSVVNSGEYTAALIENLLAVMEEKGYRGVDIDFEYILAEDREAFTEFVRQVAEVMRWNGYHTSVTLAPKTSSEQQGLLYEGKDYRALGEIADHVLLMTYEWGYTYGPPMAVAPINQVRRVVEYAVTQIAPEKIDLGIPNYGYDWPLPYERGVTKAATINNAQAVRIAIAQGAEIFFDPLAESPYFYYTENGVDHEVWFEDVRSLLAKFDLLREYGLRGCGYWQIMQWFRANWLLLYNQFYVLKEL